MMKYNLIQAISVLEKTPETLIHLLSDLPIEWTHQNEGLDTWSPYDVIGHLVHGEKTDWIPRLEIVLSISGGKTFTPYDRFAQFEMSKGKSLKDLLYEFTRLRRENIATLRSKNINEKDLDKQGIHPELGPISLRNMLAAWVVHDLGHLAQISRVMAKQYKHEIGPWTKYLTIVNNTPAEPTN